jgi:hypothetical protein
VVPAADGGGGVDVSVRVGVHFRKWTMLRNKIQSACVSELTVSYEMLLQLARQHSTRSLSDVAMEQVGADRTPAVAAAAAAAVAVSNSTPQAQLSMREFGSNLLRQLQAHDVVLAAMCGVGLLLLWILWRNRGAFGNNRDAVH